MSIGFNLGLGVGCFFSLGKRARISVSAIWSILEAGSRDGGRSLRGADVRPRLFSRPLGRKVSGGLVFQPVEHINASASISLPLLSFTFPGPRESMSAM